jgi:histidinol-phosphate/aromatic aminotransferase/cobyric acid decarboxylase-like protein
MSLIHNEKDIPTPPYTAVPHGGGFTVCIADEEDRNRIYALRHDIYASELAQHKINDSGVLRDVLDDYNSYIVAKKDGRVAGFVSITGPNAPSFSVDKYFGRALVPIPFDKYLYEIRLLSVDKEYRNSSLALLLMYATKRWVEAHGGKHIVAICRSSIIGMYVDAGLTPLGHSTKSGDVQYELAVANIEQLNNVVATKMYTFRKLEQKTVWQFPYPFFVPATCYHGGAFFTAIGEDLQTLDKKNEIINADVLDAWFPPSPAIVAALTENLPWLLQTSPPTHNKGLISVIAAVRGVDERCIFPGAGSSDLIFLGLQKLLTAGSKVLILDPSYGEYRYVLEHIVHCEIVTFPLQRADGFVVDTTSLQKEMTRGYDMVVLINPNSPTGLCITKDIMIRLLTHVPDTTLVWVDETYIEYAGSGASLEQFAAGTENVIVCKSMSKVYALSGVRAAYLCAGPHLLEGLRAQAPPWSVSLPAQLAAITALQDGRYYAEKYHETHLLRTALRDGLMKAGITEVIDGMANFLLFYLPPDVGAVPAFIAGCRLKGLFMRDVSNMGAMLGKGALRIAVKDASTNERMMAIIVDVLEAMEPMK